MIRWNFGVILIILVASFELLGSAHGRSNRVKNPLLDPSKANGFINSFLRYLIQSGAFAAKQEQDIADVIDTLQQAMSSTQSSKRGSAAKSQAMTLAFASVIADLVVIDDENGQGVSIEQKKSVIKQALEKAFMETQGSIDHSFIHEIENLIKVFEEENAQSYDDNAEDQSNDDKSYGFLQPVSDLGAPQIDAGVYGKFNLGAQNLFDSNLNLDVQPAFLTSVPSQNQQGYGIDVSGNIAQNWNMNLNQQAQQGISGTQNALNIYGLSSINTPQYFTDVLTRKLQATRVFETIAKTQLSQKDWWFMSESICRNLGNKFRIPINNSIMNQLYQRLMKGAQSNELPSLFSAAISSILGENILQTQGLLNINLDSLITQTIEGILRGLGQALNINIDIKKALDLAAQVKVDAGVGLNANAEAAVGADIRAALGADVGVGLGSDVGLGLDASVGLDANTNIDTGANADISTNLGLGFSPSADVGLGVGFNAPNIGLKFKNLLGLKLKATGVLDILASKKPSKSDIAIISKLICRFLANKFQIQLNVSMIKLLYGSLIKLNARARPDDFGKVLAAVIMNILQSQGLLNVNLNTLLTQATECILLGLSQALNINIDIKKALDLASQVKVDIGIGANTDISRNLGADAGVGVGADVAVGLGTDVDLGFGADVGTSLDASLGTDANAKLGVQVGANLDAGENADLNAKLDLGLLKSAGKGIEVGLNVPNLGLKLTNLLALKLKATGVFNVLAKKTPSQSDILNISKLISRLLGNKFQIQLNVSMIKLFYGSLIKLNGRIKPEDFANVLAATTMNILQSQGLLKINLDSLLTQATECILQGFAKALNININIKNALDLAAQVQVDIGVGVDADAGVGLGTDIGVGLGAGVGNGLGSDVGFGMGKGIGVGLNASVGVDTNLGLGFSPSTGIGLQAGLNVPDLGLKLTNLLGLKLKATGVLNILATKTPSRSDIVNISKSVSKLLANKFQIQFNGSLIKLFYNSLIKLDAMRKPDGFANVLAAVTINILQSQGFLNINLDPLLTQATECILLGLGEALNISVDIKKALDLAAQVKVDVGAGVEADIGASLAADVGVGADLGTGLDVGVGVDANTNVGIQAGANIDAGANADVNANLGLGLSPSTVARLGVGLNAPDLGLKLKNLLILKLKATGVLNILATKPPSRSDIINISKSICRLLANTFRIKLHVSMIKLLYGSLAKLDTTAKSDDFANVLAAVTINILQSQGLLNINLDTLLSQAIECILLGLGQALNINIDIKNALDLAAKVKVDAGAGVDINVGVGLGADIEAGVGLGADTGIGLDAGVGVDANANLGVQAGANLDTNLGLGLSPSADIGLGIGLDVPNLILKLRNILSLKIKATGVLNILATKTLSKSDFVNISKSICRLLANKFQIQLNVSTIKLFYGSLIKLNGRAAPNDFANVLAEVTMNILQSQGLLNINIDSLLAQATECILLGFGQALNISVDIKNALDLAAQVKVDVGAGVEADIGASLAADAGVGADLGTGLDVGVGVDANTNLGIQAAANIDAGANVDVNANLGLGLSPSTGARLGVGLNVPDLSLKLKNLLVLKLKATGVLNILATKPPSRSDIVNISKSISRLLANKFHIKLDVSMIKLLYGSLAKLDTTAKSDDFANVLTAVTINILQSQGLLNINLDTLLSQAIECILLGLGQALNINIDIKNALDLAAKVKVDAGAGVDVNAEVGLGADIEAGVGLGADAGIGLDAGVGVDANANLGVQAGANLDTNLGLGLSPSADIGLGIGLDVPNLILKFRNILSLKIKATGVLNILATKTLSKSDFVNISKSICRLLANKFQIQLNVSSIKLFYGSLIKLNGRAAPDDFANVLAEVTMNILQSQGLLNINIDSLLAQATECILLGFGQALNISVDIKNALDLAAQVKVDVGAGVEADIGASLAADAGVGADLGTGLDVGVGVDANTNLGIQAAANIDAGANVDVNANLGLGLSPSTGARLGVGLNVPDLSLKLKNLLVLKLKATGVLNILATKPPSRSDIVNISKSICRLLANKFQIKLDVSMIKLLYGSLAKLDTTAKSDDFANVLTAVTINILQSQGLLNINLDTLLSQAIECILLGLGQALNINIDIKNALDLAAKVKVDAGAGVDVNAGVGFGADIEAGLDLGADAGIGIDADVGVDANANLGIQAGADVGTSADFDVNANLGVGLKPSPGVRLGAGINVPDLSLKLKNLLSLKWKATGALNVLETKKLSKSDIVNISKLICRLLASKFQVQLNVSTIKILYVSLIKLNAKATPDDFANVLGTVTINILQSQGLLDINLDTVLTQAIECILLGFGKALNINIDIKKALDLAAQVKVDIGADVNADAGVGADIGLGLGTDIGLGVAADTELGLDANAGVEANVDLGVQVGAKVDADVNADVNSDLGLGLSPSTGVGLGVGVNAPKVSLKLQNLLALKLKATGVLNILATKRSSRSDIINISKSICRLLANKFQIKLNVPMIKLVYDSLAKLDARAKPDDFANVLAAVTMNILQSQGRLNINLNSLLTQATECILIGLGQALGINFDIQNALDLAAKVKVDAAIGVDTDLGVGLGADGGVAVDLSADVGVGADAGFGLDTSVAVDANTNLGILAGSDIDTGTNADINANLGVGLSPSADVGLRIGTKVPDLGLKLKNLLALKLKATGVLNILGTKRPSKSDIVNISKLICRLLANKFRIQINVPMIKLLYGSLIKLNVRATPEDFANVLATVTINILQSQGLLDINFDTLLTQSTECILLGVGQALNINLDIKKALDLAAQVKVDIDADVNADAGVGTDVGLDIGADIGLGVGADTGVSLDANAGADSNANLGAQAGAKVDADVNTDINADLGSGLSPSTGARLGVGLNVPDLGLKLKNLLVWKLKAAGGLTYSPQKPIKIRYLEYSKINLKASSGINSDKLDVL
ncbi:uncharacterized protein LOC118189811 [Stegodyphus dumicola]|uniref:uncharacterized protein LOC118189811 n=1 Tax=Stegodyphus dumicola TaxID=202533 RepID=UPI0015A958DC|nr:uncharacterized protein LOC118189811 [Stegodyphus dumicola]